jgi:hypothetical protein
MNNSVDNIINKYTKEKSNIPKYSPKKASPKKYSPKKASPKKASPKKASPTKKNTINNNTNDVKKRNQSFYLFSKTYDDIKSYINKSGKNLSLINEKKQQAREDINMVRSKAGLSRYLKSGLSLGYWKDKNINDAKEKYKKTLVNSKSNSLKILSELDLKNANLVKLVGKVEKKIKNETNEKLKYKYKAGIFENEISEKKNAENKIKKAKNMLENAKALKTILNKRKKEAKILANATK